MQVEINLSEEIQKEFDKMVNDRCIDVNKYVQRLVENALGMEKECNKQHPGRELALRF
jgi:phage terminase small subunit